jgi:hypothetical protein
MIQGFVSLSAPSDSLCVEVSRMKAVLRSFSARDKAGKPIMTIREPRIRLDKGSRLLVSSTHAESRKDLGDGIVFATGNIPYYFVLNEPVNGSAAGFFVQADDVKTISLAALDLPTNVDAGQPEGPLPASDHVPDSEPEASLVVEVSGKKALAHIFHARDKAGKPIMEIREPRARLERGSRLAVSATRSESSKDKGDGVIHATGNIPFYFVLDLPSNGEAAGLYIKAVDVKLV